MCTVERHVGIVDWYKGAVERYVGTVERCVGIVETCSFVSAPILAEVFERNASAENNETCNLDVNSRHAWRRTDKRQRKC